MSTDLAPNAEMLEAMDPDLPFLASAAAIEIDNLVAGRDSDPAPVTKLATLLRNSFGCPKPDGSMQSLLDPATLVVLNEAVVLSGSTQLNTVSDLVGRARNIADELSQATATSNSSTLEWARTFCVALSRSSASFHSSILDMRPSHPFRR